MNKILKYLLQGILLIVPLAATIYVIVKLLRLVDGIIPDDLFEVYLPGIGDFYIGSIPGIGIFLLICFLTLLGFLGSTFIATPFIKYTQRLLDRVPLVKVIYSSIRDLLGAFVGQKKKFNQPVMVKINEGNLFKLGFITETDLSQLGIDDDYIAVYFPHSYNFSGNLFVVQKSKVKPIEGNSGEIMKFIVSGGVTSINEKS